ncbi:MAG: TonB-dependent receptor [Saprospiraceae bacterium]|nr:TonB-dependent receptor [Saprospiraceae bacterium]
MNTFCKKSFLLVFSLIALAFSVMAQQGTIRGRVIDDLTGDAVMFANVVVKETGTGATTDLDGNYEIVTAPGTYTLLISYIGFNDFIISDVVVTANKVNIVDIRMKESSQVIEEVVITASQVRNTESAISTIKQRTPNLLDGISSQTIKRNGDGNAGEALRRVTGVSVEGGKHIVVRGLGDRYTKITLNSIEIPGLDPDRNSVQTDIFPTNLIDNLLVYKTFSPDLPGDFTGGAVDIVTKDFPEQKTFSASVSMGYNPDMHFNPNFLNYNGGKTDALGFDDGTRQLPFYKNTVLPDASLKNPALESATKAFNPELAAKETGNNLNKSFSLAYGNQSKLGSGVLGYIFGMNYSHGYNHYEGLQLGEYYRNTTNTGYFVNRETNGTLSEVNVLWSALGGISYKKAGHKIGLEVLRIQSADSKAARLTQANLEINSSVIQRDNLEFYQREITNLALSGKHMFAKGKLSLDWKLSPTLVSVDEPDIRTTGFDITEEGNPVLRPAVGAEVTRIYRYLNEVNYNGRFDLSYIFKIGNKESKIKAGSYNSIKERDFEIYNFLIRVNNQTELNLEGNPDNILKEGNLWTAYDRTGAYVVGNYEPANTFKANQRIYSAYLMHELPVGEKLKVSYGARLEKATTRYTGSNNQGTIIYNGQKVFDKMSLLPSLNVMYELMPKTNLRVSFNRTLARPTFKENSIAQIQDRITDRTFLGNIGLKQTDINNYDLRLEKYFNGGELISVTTFFKQFYNPIQLTVYDAANPTNFIPRNFENTNVYGVELEASKRLSFLSERFSNFLMSANYTVVNADMPLIGLSPSILNVALSYLNVQTGWEASATYNVQSSKLSVVGIDRIEDVYENPFKSLNFRISKQLGSDNQYAVSILGENMLNSQKLRSYDTFDGSNAVFDLYKPGRLFTVTLGYSLK